uniref:Exported protein n=1 Tax=Parastrongyloides trichosuri TaxID=131310 RepID=A0A0N5A1I8_PARTI
MARLILTILLIAFLTVTLFATPTHKLEEHGRKNHDNKRVGNNDDQKMMKVSLMDDKDFELDRIVSKTVVEKHDDDKKVVSKNDGHSKMETTTKKLLQKGSILPTSEEDHLPNSDEDDYYDSDEHESLSSDMFFDLFHDLKDKFTKVSHSISEGASIAAEKLSDLSHKTHYAYAVSKDSILDAEEKVANKAHDLFLYTEEEFNYVISEMRSEANRHALFIGIISGICVYFLMFPVTFLLKVCVRRLKQNKSRIPFFSKYSRNEKVPLLPNEKMGVRAVDYSL